MLIYHVLGSLVGQASDNARSLSENINSYTNLADFFQTLKERFVTSAHASMARNTFNFAVQKNDENIRAFHARLQTLWMDSYARDDEPWLFDPNIICPLPNRINEPGMRCVRLIEQFIKGIKSDVIRFNLRRNVMQAREQYDHYNLVLQDALAMSALYGQLTAEQQHHKISARFHHIAPTYDDPDVSYTYTNSQSRGGQQRSVPMELGYAKGKKGRKQGKRKPNRFSSKPRRVHMATTDKVSSEKRADPTTVAYCSYHKSEKHNDSNCRAQKGKRDGANLNAMPQGNKTKKATKCFNCGKTGHWAKECRQKRKQKRVGLGYLQEQFDLFDQEN